METAQREAARRLHRVTKSGTQEIQGQYMQFAYVDVLLILAHLAPGCHPVWLFLVCHCGNKWGSRKFVFSLSCEKCETVLIHNRLKISNATQKGHHVLKECMFSVFIAKPGVLCFYMKLRVGRRKEVESSLFVE